MHQNFQALLPTRPCREALGPYKGADRAPKSGSTDLAPSVLEEGAFKPNQIKYSPVLWHEMKKVFSSEFS